MNMAGNHVRGARNENLAGGEAMALESSRCRPMSAVEIGGIDLTDDRRRDAK